MTPGFNDDIKCIRINLDPIPSTYRPLVFYLVTHGLFSLLTELLMRMLGFRRYYSGSLEYWHRAGGGSESTQDGREKKDSTEKGGVKEGKSIPLVFCHGLGIGVLSYFTLVQKLVAMDPSRPIFMTSMPHISMRIVEKQASPAQVVAGVQEMLQGHGHSSAHFAGHSFGTIVCAWVVKAVPSMVSHLTMLDPVCLLLCKHDVAFSFLHKEPANMPELLMQWFVGHELYIAHSLTRTFNWQSNILWPDEIPCPATIVLSADDHVVPSSSVRKQLASFVKRGVNLYPLDVVWLEDRGHAGFLLHPPSFDQILGLLQK